MLLKENPLFQNKTSLKSVIVNKTEINIYSFCVAQYQINVQSAQTHMYLQAGI